MKSKIEFCPNPLAVTIHTNFNIQNNAALKLIVEHIEGVEEIVCWELNKYSFLVIVGKMFDRPQIAETIQQKIEEFCKD